MWAIIGSSGFESFEEFEILETLPRETPFGLCSNGFYRISINNQEALFLCRTSHEEDLLPSKINYKANIYALKKYGATTIIALSSVRSLKSDLKPGDMIVPSQYMDQTKGLRSSTFCDNGLLSYVSLTNPITKDIANQMQKSRSDFDFNIHFDSSYVCIEGPQFPTMLDAKCYQNMGGGIIGMTGFPEFALAREAGICYVSCNFVVDYVPWDETVENYDCILQVRHGNYSKALKTILWLVSSLPEYASKDCNNLGIASFISNDTKMLTPQQKSWFDVISQDNSKKDVNKIENILKTQLYHGNKPIPAKLQNLLNFINKYKKDKAETLDSIRRASASLSLYASKPIGVASVRNFTVKHGSEEVNVRFYHPDPAKQLPMMIYAHGGGYVSGTLDSFDSHCRNLAINLNYIVISVDYRLAPENKFPAALDDVYSVSCWAYKNADKLKATNLKMVLAGDSAGANLVVLAAYKSLSDANIKIESQILFYPSTDLSHNTQSIHQFAQGYLLEAKKTLWYSKQYLPEDIDAKNPIVSPLYIADLSKMPRTIVFTAGYDPLRDEGILYVEELMKQGVSAHHYHFDNLIHGFINFSKLIPDEMGILYQRTENFLNNIS